MENKTIGEEWKSFINNVSGPVMLILIISIIILFFVSAVFVKGNELKIILTSIAAIFTGVVGARIERNWSEADSDKLVAARGKIATRSLGELLFIVNKMKNRLGRFSTEMTSEVEDDQNKMVLQLLANNIDLCDIMSENVIHSMENWNDVIPGADIPKEYRAVVKYENEKIDLLKEVAALKGRLQTEKELGDKEKGELRNELSQYKEKLEKVKNDLENAKAGIVSTIGSGAFASLATTSLHDIASDSTILWLDSGKVTSGPILYPERTCEKCENKLDNQYMENICPECKKGGES